MARSLSLSTRIEDSRDVLKAMILQEEKHYKCPNYLSLSTDTYQAPLAIPVPSSLQIVEEIAGLVTDVRYASPVKNKEDKRCISPGSSMCDLYKDSHCTSTSTSTSLPQHHEEEKCGTRRLHDHHHLHHRHHHHLRHRSSQETLCLSAWRHEMFDWAYAVCRTFNIDNIVLEVAFNVLDRYIAVELSSSDEIIGGNLPVTREDFQLFSMVSIYIASKIFNRHQKLELSDLIDMAQNYYTQDDITTTECDILSALNWHVHPPTVIDYCDVYLTLFPQQHQHNHQRYKNDSNSSSSTSSQSPSLPSPSTMAEAEKQILEGKCKDIAEAALEDEYFLDKAHSVIALAVVLLATDASRGCGRDPTALQTFLQNIQGVVNVHKSEFDSILRRLECSC